VLLLRRALVGLKQAGHAVVLLAPEEAGRALVGRGAADADALLAWERAELATFLSDGGGPSLPEELRSLDAAIVYSRSQQLARAVAGATSRLLVWNPRPSGAEHASRHLARPLSELGAAVPEAIPSIVAERDALAAPSSLLARLPHRFLALHPGSGSPRKNWPAERFLALAQIASPDRPWLLVAGPADDAAVDLLASDPRAVVASGQPARGLGALLARAEAYVGNDSGVSHLAAAFGAPTLALFGPTDPSVWSPVGSRVTVLRSPTGRMEDLPLDEAVAGLERLRATSAVPGRPSD
jgi:ADP-heptose:LPS heptosyltransferase